MGEQDTSQNLRQRMKTAVTSRREQAERRGGWEVSGTSRWGVTEALQ